MMWSEWEPPCRESELVRRVLMWLVVAYVTTADLVMSGLPVLPASFRWPGYLQAIVTLGGLLGIAGFFAPIWRRITQARHRGILYRAGAAALVPAVTCGFVFDPPWWVQDAGVLAWVGLYLSLVGAAMTIVTAAWPGRGWRGWLHRQGERLKFTFRVAIIGPRYGDY